MPGLATSATNAWESGMTEQRRKQGEAGFWIRVSVMAVAVFLVAAAPQTQAQTYSVIHSFSGNADGSFPETGLTVDRNGNLYGTTTAGGRGSCSSEFGPGCGSIFKMSRSGSGWIVTPLYEFAGGTADGASSVSRLIFGPDGRIYGATINGGLGTCDSVFGTGCGIVFSLQPSGTICRTPMCPWTETVLYRFTGRGDGGEPLGDLAFDRAGNLYGATLGGGAHAGGVVFKLTPSSGGWTESVLYNFTGDADGGHPWGGVAFDSAGNLYGTTAGGGFIDNGVCSEGCGTVWKLTPSGSGWAETTVHTFNGTDGNFSAASFVFDQQGNLYGDATSGGTNDGGTVFESTPANGGWDLSILQQSLSGGTQGGSWASLTLDNAGNLLGTAKGGGVHGGGSVFRLTESGGAGRSPTFTTSSIRATANIR